MRAVGAGRGGDFLALSRPRVGRKDIAFIRVNPGGGDRFLRGRAGEDFLRPLI